MTDRDEESPEELEAREFLEGAFGLKVTRVPGGERKSPDYLVDGDDPGYMVEVKSRFDDGGYLEALAAGKVAESERRLGHDRWGADNARKALKQFREADPDHRRYWILWYAVKCEGGADSMFNQAVGTLYGARQVAYFDEASQENHGRNCLYVVHGVFERWPEIDGAFVAGGESITFCANEFSERPNAFESSKIYQEFARRGGPNTAVKLESEKGFFAVRDRSVDRRDEEAVSRHLCEKYGLKKVHILDVKEYAAAVLVPRKEPRQE